MHDYVVPFRDEDGSADCILESAEGSQFAVDSAALRLHSPVFRTMLQSSAVKREQGTLSSTSVLTLPFPEDAVGFFLRHLVPSAYLVNGKPPKMPAFKKSLELGGGYMLLRMLMRMCTQYECPHVLDTLSKIHLPALALAWPLEAWALAVRYSRLEEARAAIRLLAREEVGVPLDQAHMWDAHLERIILGKRDVDISDLSLSTLDTIPLASIRRFCAVRALVVASTCGQYTWLDAARDFKLW